MPLDRRSITTIATLAAASLISAACSSAPTGNGAPSAAGAPSARQSSAPATGTPSLPGDGPVGAADAWLAVGQAGQVGLEVIQASTRDAIFDLPAGAPDDAWATMVATERVVGGTLVQELEVGSQLPGRSWTIDGDWSLPTVGLDALPVGVSADGQTIVLVERAAAGAGGTSRFAILSRSFNAAPRIVTLDGEFEYDALSPDGRTLYLVEHLAAPPEGHYQVRALDTVSGALRDGAIADKRNLDEAMAGYPIAQLRRPDGEVFTLYRGAEHPFIHALNTVDGWALCIDLPSVGADDAESALDWGLAASPDGHTVFAVNATLGLATEVDANDLSVRTSTRFATPATAAGFITLAKFGHEPSGPVGRRAIVSPDGSTLFAAGSAGIVRVATNDLALSSTLLAGSAVDALALTPNGATLYALLHQGGRIVALDASSGNVVGRVPGDGFDRLVAVVSW